MSCRVRPCRVVSGGVVSGGVVSCYGPSLPVSAACSQGHNLEDCYTKLQEMVDAAVTKPKVRKMRTGVSAATKKSYVQEKRRRSDIKKARSSKRDDW